LHGVILNGAPHLLRLDPPLSAHAGPDGIPDGLKVR
jgi:hypothetical protein